MSALFYALLAVVVLVCIALVGANPQLGLQTIFTAAIPYAAFAVFVGGVIHRIRNWAASRVPFRIPTTCGQKKSLPWIENDNLESPHNTLGVIGRMALEVLCFRSLFRNTKTQVTEQGEVRYGSEKFLWVAAMAFHWCFLIILLRHFRLFAEPTPLPVIWLQDLDAFFQVGVPEVYLSNLVILGGLGYLLWRRLFNPRVRYISLAADYFPLLLLFGIVISGMLMRYVVKTDLAAVKELTVGLVALSPKIPRGAGPTFYVHLFLVSSLLVYFPFSKLMHMGGVFLSPTRNLANNNRMARHVNPWNPKVKTHSYEEYEDEFRELMAEAGMPLEKPLPAGAKADEKQK